MTAPERAASRRSPISWRRALGYALLWGLAFEALESFVLPLGDLSWRQLLEFALQTSDIWLVCTFGVACLAMFAEPRMSTAKLALSTVAVALALAAAGVLLGDVGTEVALFQKPRSFATRFAYGAWGCLFYGGLFMLVLVLVMRAERTRSLLGHAEIARSQTETVLSQAQLQALRGQVDPDLLLRVMAEVQRRYAANAAAAERLLDHLVGFLRSAMPGVRSGCSTLAAELALVQSYIQLWAELEPLRAGWQVDIETPIPDLPFPPLLLLPVLDHGSGGRVSMRREADRVMLSLDGPREAGELPAPLAYRLRVGLQATFGESWTLSLNEVDAAGTPALLLSLPIDMQALSPRAAGTTSTQKR